MKTEPYTSARYMPFGDSALLVEFGNVISLEVNLKVAALNEAVLKTEIQGVEELVPTFRSLLVRFDPLKITYNRLVLHIKEIEKTLKKSKFGLRGRKITVPVVYGGEYGPDLNYVARYHKLSEEEVITLHSEKRYHVYMIGFIAGFPYLGEVPHKIATPRLETPRLKVPAGSVGIAEKQTGIYPREAPGGWQIIGRTPIKLFDPALQPPAVLMPGDTVRFKPIFEEKFKTIRSAITKDQHSFSFEG